MVNNTVMTMIFFLMNILIYLTTYPNLPILPQTKNPATGRGLRVIILAFFVCDIVSEVQAYRYDEGGGEAGPGELFGSGIGDGDARPGVEEISKVVVG